MKIGIITDIHSNIYALKNVLDEFKKLKVEKIICCGDIIGIGPNPDETVKELIKVKNLIAVRGNHETYMINGLPKKVHDNERSMDIEEIKNHKWTHSKLTNTSKEFLRSLPLYKKIEIENKNIYITHYPINELGEYKKFIKTPSVFENEELFNDINADIVIYGHTHTANINNNNDKWYINTGALGCPINTNNATAGVLDIEKNNVKVQLLNIEYDVEAVVNEIKNLKFPLYEKILKIFYKT